MNKYSNLLKNILEKRIFEYSESFGLRPYHMKILVYAVLKHRSEALNHLFKRLKINSKDLIEKISLMKTKNFSISVNNKTGKKYRNYNSVHNRILISMAIKESGKDREIKTEHILFGILKYKGTNSIILNFKKIIKKSGITLKEMIGAMVYYDLLKTQNQDDNKCKIKKLNKTRIDKIKKLDKARIDKMEKRLISSGWILNLNLSVLEENEKFIGREKEIKRALRILCRKQKQNLIIIGESGIGKTSFVKAIVQNVVTGKAPKKISQNIFYQIFLDNIVSGTKYRGDFEQRIKDILDFIKIKKDMLGITSILFIDEIHTLRGAGAVDGQIDASSMLKPKISSGEIRCIGASTNEEYKKYIMPDKALLRRFTNIYLNEPTNEQCENILNNIKKDFEDFHNVIITDDSIKEIVFLTGKYIKNRFFPDKAIDILDEICSKVNLINSDFNKKIEINKFIVRDVVGEFIRVPMDIILGDEKKRLSNMGNNIKKVLIGQNHAVDKVIRSIYSARTRFSNPDKPIAVYLFLGSTGVGKTFLSKIISKEMFGIKKIIRIDMSEYSEKESVSKLIGSPPGYIGYQESNQLADLVRDNPYCVVLLDEIEKAHSTIHNLFLQIFDEGNLTDALGRSVDFRNTIIIMTSNIGASKLSFKNKKIGFLNPSDEDKKKDIEKFLLSKVKKFFSPEFINRIDEIIFFNKLNKENILKILSNEIDIITKRLDKLGYKIFVSEDVKKFLLEKGYSPVYGARSISRIIRKFIEHPLSKMVIDNELTIDKKVFIKLDKKAFKINFVLEEIETANMC